MAATGWGVTFGDGSFFPFKSGNVQDDEMNAKHFASLNDNEGAIASPLGGADAYAPPSQPTCQVFGQKRTLDDVNRVADVVLLEVPEDATSDVPPYR